MKRIEQMTGNIDRLSAVLRHSGKAKILKENEVAVKECKLAAKEQMCAE